MGCLPETGGCERLRTDPFVNFLNEQEGSLYGHEQCLDRVYRNTPQPEALYRDNDKIIVIERKTIVWPVNYVENHKIDHSVSDLLYSRLHDSFLDDYYQLRLASIANFKSAIRETFISNMVGEILTKAPLIRADKPIGGHGWVFRRLCKWEIEPEQEKGLEICWKGSELIIPNPCCLPQNLNKQIDRIFDSCRQKFSSYMHARRSLLIEPQGNLYFTDSEWWKLVFQAKSPPIQIGEIWHSTYDYIDDKEYGWAYDNILVQPPTSI